MLVLARRHKTGSTRYNIMIADHNICPITMWIRILIVQKDPYLEILITDSFMFLSYFMNLVV